MKISSSLMTLTLAATFSFATSALAKKSEQAMLDQACEDARQVALAPRKKEIYQECITKFKKEKSVCEKEAAVYNGNRINGAPMFYELPACVKAFEYRKKAANQ